MPRKRDRSPPPVWPTSLFIPAHHLERRAAAAAAGDARFGDAVLPPAARVRRAPRVGHLLHAVRYAGEIKEAGETGGMWGAARVGRRSTPRPALDSYLTRCISPCRLQKGRQQARRAFAPALGVCAPAQPPPRARHRRPL